jgi:anti-anti-sigma factor
MKTATPRVELKGFDGGIVLAFNDSAFTEQTQVECLEREILPMLESTQAKRVVIDFAKVRFFSTPFFSLIIKIRQKAGLVQICNLDRKVREIFDVTHLTQIFPVCKDPLS